MERNRCYEIENKKSWNNLPRDILALIHNQLFVVDQIRFRAVCKSWKIPEDMIDHSNYHLMPWLISYSWLDTPLSPSGDSLPFECEITDPVSKQIRIVSNALTVPNMIEKSNKTATNPKMYATFQGWALLVWEWPTTINVYVHNVFTNQLLTLPHLTLLHQNMCYRLMWRATFLNNETEIFLVFRNYMRWRLCCVATFCDEKWSTQVLDGDIRDVRYLESKAMQYIKGDGDEKGKVYFLNWCGLLCYSLEAKSCELIPLNKMNEMCYWLVEKDNELIMVTQDFIERCSNLIWSIFKFDRHQKRWINIEKSLKNTTICISESPKSSFMTTSVKNTRQQDCTLFYVNTDRHEKMVYMNCYSITEKKLIKSEKYRWRRTDQVMNIIEFPYVNYQLGS